MLKNSKYDGYRRGIASIVYKCFDIITVSFEDKSASGGAIKSMQIKQLANKLYKPVIKKFTKK